MTPGLGAAALAALQGTAPGPAGIPDPFPGPSPWGPAQYAGAAFYLVLFLAGLWGTWVLVRDAPDGPGEGAS